MFKKVLSFAMALTLCIPCVVEVQSEVGTQIEVSADTTTESEKATEMFNLVNAYRAENGLKPFKTCAIMQQMANTRAKEITGGNYLTRGSSNSYYNSIFVENNISTFTYSQNTYWGGVGYDSPAYAISEMKISDRQNSNMLSTAYEYMGVGVYVEDNKTYYYQLFCTSDDLQEDDVTVTTTTTTSVTTETTTTTTTENITTTTEPITTTTAITNATLSDEELRQKYDLDVNKNGVVNAIDLIILKKYLLGQLKY